MNLGSKSSREMFTVWLPEFKSRVAGLYNYISNQSRHVQVNTLIYSLSSHT